MFISDFAIKRPLITVVAMLVLVVAGLFSLAQLKTDEFPEVSPPVVLTTIVYPGASPDQVERELLDPIEEAIQGISGVDKVNGEARDGFAQIVTTFLFTKDLQQATQDIRDAISAKRPDLPAEMKEPLLTRFNPTDLPIVTLALSSEVLTPAQLTLLADPGITRELRALAGVANVQVSGAVKRELSVRLKPQAMQAAGIAVPQVVAALQSQNLAVPVGRITGALDERTIRLKGRVESAQDFMKIIVAEKNGAIVRLGDVADAIDGTEEQRTLALFNDREAVSIDITKSQGFSTTDVADRIKAAVKRVEATLPPGAKLEMVKDAGQRVTDSVRNVEGTLFEGALLTVLVVFIFLNSWRSTVITGLALPVSVMASFVAVWAFGFTLNTMSLLGLSLAIGILIDDAIVVRENIVRHVEMGKDHFTAAREGTDEIGLAVTATTFAIICVFVPIAFIANEAGQWFKPFALTIACSVAVSLFVSFSLDPMLSAYWPDPHVPEDKKWFITRALDRFNAWFNRMSNGYRGVIGWALDHRWSVVALSVGTFIFALAMPAMGLVGFSFFPADDNSEILVTVETPPGSNLDFTRLKVAEAGRMARAFPEVMYTLTTVGGASGAVDNATMYVKLTKKAERTRSADSLSALLRAQVPAIGGATVSVFTNTFQGNQKQIQIQLRGTDPAALLATAERFVAQARKVPGAVDVGLSTKGQKPELDVEVNRGLAGSLGLTVGSVAQALRPAFAGIETGDWVDPTGETRKVVLRLDDALRSRPADLEQLPIALSGPGGEGGGTIPLGQVARVTSSVGPAIITHLNRDNVVNVEANAAGRPLSQVLADITAATDTIPLPPGVRLSQGGEVESQNVVFTSMLAAMGVAVLLMYLILVIQFGSFLDPLAIMLSLPLSLIGVMMALAITGNTINLMSLIGVLLLMGIVAKNAILLIDFAKWAREKDGVPLREALIEAGAIRLRPILMTTFALVAGMIPIALGTGEGAGFRAPLGVAAVGGVITSTILTLLAIPTFYEILDEWRHWFASKVGMRAPKTGEFRVVPGGPMPEAGD
jgi:hydrophobic/amphiphilic exporter-1 (mainly G- bacteria), HAE1 family